MTGRLTREGELHVTALCDRLGQSQPIMSFSRFVLAKPNGYAQAFRTIRESGLCAVAKRRTPGPLTRRKK